MAPPCEELDPVRYQACVRAENDILFLGKSTKTVATRAAPFDSSVHQIVCRLGLHPDPTGGAYSAASDHLAVFRGGATSKGRGEEEKRKVGAYVWSCGGGCGAR